MEMKLARQKKKKKQIVNSLLLPSRNVIIVLQVIRKWLINFKWESDITVFRE